jgi:CHAT domain-containing protein/Tfp pilus assembly protein PilF
VNKAPLDARLAEARQAFDEGERLRQAGQYVQAIPLAERALEQRQAVLGNTHPEVAQCLDLLGDLYRRSGEHARAAPLLQRALSLREAVLGKDHPDVAQSLNSLATLYWAQGLYARAEPLYERALAIQEAALGKDHPDVANTLTNLATVLWDHGLYARIEPLLDRALAIQETRLGRDHPDVASSLNILASLYWAHGQYARAEPVFQRALAIREAAQGEHHSDVALVVNNLASLYWAQGHYARAEPLFQRALTIWETALGKDHPDVAYSLNNLALVYRDQEQYTRAEPLFQRALAIREAALGKDHPEVAASLSHLASLYWAQGQYARAEPLFQRALSVQETALGKHHPYVADSLTNLANLSMAQGQYARAEPLLQRAVATWEAAVGRDHPYVADSLNRMAQLRLARGHLAEALPLFERAFEISETYLRQEVYGFSETRLASVLQKLHADEERLYALARAHPDNAEVRRLAFTAALLRKGRSVEEISNTSRIIYRSLGQEERELYERLRTLRTQLSTLSLAGPGELSNESYQQRLKELADQGDALEEELARRSAPQRALRTQPSPSELLDRVAAALPRNGALVEFVAYNEAPLIPRPGAVTLQAPSQLRYLARLLFADGRTHAVDLGPTAPIDNAALRLHELLSGSSARYRPGAQALYQLAFQPLVPLLGQVQRLFLSPDGQLSLVPFSALHDGRRFLVDVWDIAYLTSGQELLPRPSDTPTARSVVVLADPDFGASPAAPVLTAQVDAASTERSTSLERFFSSLRADMVDRPLPPLPGTRREAEAIQRMFPEAQLLLGSAATKDALLRLPTPDILHIATHGFFLEDAAPSEASREVQLFGAMGEASPAQLPPNPLLRSGLVLADAHAQAHPTGSRRREDSLITALELAALDLWGTQLVVLSACDTGRGDVKLGQGVYGLRHALVVAGVETLVTSLWKVNDVATQELMEAYYRQLLAGQGRTTALRQAMLALRQKRPHPHFWAPFIAVGRDTPLRERGPHTP